MAAPNVYTNDMEGKTLLKLAIAIAVVVLIWKKGIPWWNAQHASQASATTSTAPENDDCVSAAEAASDAWGSGIGRFANPPYDLAAWGDFRSQIEQQARRAEEKCLCADPSCTTVKDAMSDLRTLVQQMDTSLRSGTPPPDDLVQRQQAIDDAINTAHDLVRQGK